MKQRETVAQKHMKTAQRGSGHRDKEWRPGLKACRELAGDWRVKPGL